MTGELESLTEKNLLVSQESDFGTRHTMLETIREFGLEVLNEAGEEGTVRALHAGHFMELAERAAPELTGPEQAAWFDRLETEHDNVRAALTWALDTGEIEVALRLGSAMTRFWLARGYFQEGRQWLGRALAAERGSLPLQAAALSAAGSLAEHQNEVAPAEALHRQALAIWRRLDDRRQIAASCASLGNVAQDSGEYSKAIELHQEALTLYRLEGDDWGMVRAFNNLGAVAYYQGAYERAQEYWAEALSAIRKIGDTRSECQLLNNLGALAYQRGDLPEARKIHEQVLALRRRLGDKQGIASSLINLSEVARQENGSAQTEPMLQEAVLLAREIGDKPLTAVALAHLAMASREHGALDRASALSLESIQLFRETHDQRGLAGALLVMASVLVDQQQPRRAVRLFVAADTLRDSIDAAWEPVEQEALDRGLDQARAILGDDEFAAIQLEARTVTFEHVLARPIVFDPGAIVVSDLPRRRSDRVRTARSSVDLLTALADD